MRKCWKMIWVVKNIESRPVPGGSFLYNFTVVGMTYIVRTTLLVQLLHGGAIFLESFT